MLPVKAIRLTVGSLVAADATYLAPAADANKIALVKASFTPDENLVIGDVTLADFDGSTPLLVGVGAQNVGLNPATGDQRITLKDPAGGFRWVTTGLTNLPQTIYGAILMNNAGTTLLAMEVFDTPLVLQEVGQDVVRGSFGFDIVAAPLSYMQI